LLRNKPPRVRDRFRLVVSGGAAITVSSIAIFELWYGEARSGRPEENAERLRVFLSDDLSVLPFQKADAALAGELRASLETGGTPIGPYDLLIAAQAQRSGSTLATSNLSGFVRVPGLVVQDWTVGT
jgi:tRNA(fMet)-specific endonuclease VapC